MARFAFRAAGMDLVVTKPIEVHRLFEALQMALDCDDDSIEAVA